MGLKAVAAAKAASAAAKQAAAQAEATICFDQLISLHPLNVQAIAMAQNTNLAALQAEQAQAPSVQPSVSSILQQKVSNLLRPIWRSTSMEFQCRLFLLQCWALDSDTSVYQYTKAIQGRYWV